MSTASPIPMLDAALRGGAVALLLLIAVLLLRNARAAPAARYGAFFALSTACYVVISSPDVFYLHAWWLLPLRLASLGNPALFWLFAVASFDDEFRASWRDAAVWLGAIAFGASCVFLAPAFGGLLFQAMQLVFVGLAIRQALIGRTADLVEVRRRFRLVVVTAAALYTLVIMVLEYVSHGPALPGPLSLANAAGLFVLVFAIAVIQLSLSSSGQFLPLAAPPRPAPGAPPPASDEQETALLLALRRLMDVDKVYREDGLSIAALALKLGIPEYRLRRLINQRLGHRNFSGFVNRYRLADAMAALGDRGQAGVPILTIALDAGFQSLGPFNRAFKAETGMTPSDYRRRRLGDTGADV